jgi:hypothetical protein
MVKGDKEVYQFNNVFIIVLIFIYFDLHVWIGVCVNETPFIYILCISLCGFK